MKIALVTFVALVISSPSCRGCDFGAWRLSEDDLASFASSSGYNRDIDTNCGPNDPVPPNRVDTSDRLKMLREEMDAEALDAYIVPFDDQGRREYVSGFTGSNGDAIVTLDQAACWTDGRYFLQASQELDCNWRLMKMSMPGVPTYTEWLLGDAGLPQSEI